MRPTISIISILLSTMAASFGQVDCRTAAERVRKAVISDPATVLEIISLEIGKNSDCSCEIVKASIEASTASAELVASIVECAIIASPENMRIIAQCAIAIAPDALPQVQAVLARLDPNKGEGDGGAKSAKDAKSSKDSQGKAIVPGDNGNPLDFTASPVIPPLHLLPSLITDIPKVTEVDPPCRFSKERELADQETERSR